ncbi:MAG: class I SAM-dependent methyltransferase [Polyangia bacterium]
MGSKVTTQVGGCVKGALAFLDRNNIVRDRCVREWARSLPGGSSILDVGAGAAKYRALFTHCQYKTQDHPAVSYGDVDIRSDITSIPLPNASLDAILCTEVLEHVPDPIGAVREMARLLRPDARLLLTVPAACRVHSVPTHFWGGFAPDFFRQILPPCGFAVDELRPLGNWSQYMAQELGRLPQVVRDHTALPLRRFLWALLWPTFRIAVPLAFLGFSQVDKSEDLPLGWMCFARRSGSA